MVVYGYTYMRSVALVMRNGVVTNADGLLYIMTIRRLLPYETDGCTVWYAFRTPPAPQLLRTRT
jgi:hypothetical protein